MNECTLKVPFIWNQLYVYKSSYLLCKSRLNKTYIFKKIWLGFGFAVHCFDERGEQLKPKLFTVLINNQTYYLVRRWNENLKIYYFQLFSVLIDKYYILLLANHIKEIEILIYNFVNIFKLVSVFVMMAELRMKIDVDDYKGISVFQGCFFLREN